jgi:hypothetical protein
LVLICPRFGIVYLVLQLIPPLSIAFLLTSAAGSALWAIKLEEEAHDEERGGIDDDPPPPYEDDPI